MEVVAATPSGGGVPPFHNHDVREWSRIDSLTGVLERARLETDHWTASTNNSSHKYGKVVDSRARSGANGGLQQQARRQFEVFHSQVPGGRLQVIKTHTVSSSRWTNKTTPTLEHKDVAPDFEDLQLSLNPLDLSSQKSKASVGRSVGRRPPSRPRVRDERPSSQNAPLRDVHQAAATNLHRVSRLCHQIHENAVKQAFGKRPSIRDRQSGDGSVEIFEIEKPSVNGHVELKRTKSTSSEELHLLTEKDKTNKSIEDLEDLEQLQNWRRTSKIRRSLQFPKQNKPPPARPPDLPVNTGSVRKIREDLETGRRLSTALRGNNVDLEALDQILQSISSSSSVHSDKASINGDKYEQPERDQQIEPKKNKRNSFVTVESLQEVRGRLRRTSSPTLDIYKDDNNKAEELKEEEIDDGIVTEDNSKFGEMPVSDNAQSRVRSYVYGMEAMLSKKPFQGTGSLESRSSSKSNGSSTNRSEDWYNRRKSYGFEQVHNQQDTPTISSKNKSLVESSTDSGICRSTEIVVVPTANKIKTSDYNSDSESEKKVPFNGVHNGNGVFNVGSVKKYSSIFEQKGNDPFESKKAQDELSTIWNRRASLNGQSDFEESDLKNEIEGTTITIPISDSSFELRNSWNGDHEIKRHSIAVDESKYVNRIADNKFRRTSLAMNDAFLQENDDDYLSQGKRNRRVEFCKTEVHFAADSGRVNIVETDDKPPPTQNFRRRRRNSGLVGTQLGDFNRNGLPILHFGDSSYEKNLLGIADVEKIEEDASSPLNSYFENLQAENDSISNTVTVTTNHFQHEFQDNEEEHKENYEIEVPKGILKNKPIKPKPYILGDSGDLLKESDNSESDIWGVKLKPVQKLESPIWRSTVTLRNTLYEKPLEVEPVPEYYKEKEVVLEQPPEFQKLLRSLRPTRKAESESDFDHFDDLKLMVPQKDLPKRSSWSVADRIKQVEDIQKTESKGYSTKVNFGNGEAIVVESSAESDKERHPTWPKHEEIKDAKKQILNKGLVVRIGRDDSNSKHTVCSKTTTDRDSSGVTTTTKITIDLSPSPTDKNLNPPIFNSVRLPRASLHSFKSTSLILNTFKTETNSHKINEKANIKIPQQLEALRKLYEDVQSDSEADKEVQSFMSKKTEESDLNQFDDDHSSVVSGSWSKMRAFRNLNQELSKNVMKASPGIHFDSHAHIEKDFSNLRITTQNVHHTPTKISIRQSPVKELESKAKIAAKNYSPVVLRKSYGLKKTELKSAFNSDKLSSPSLVFGQNRNEHISYRNKSPTKLENRSQPPNAENVRKGSSNRLVLRQPKKSEMAYFGVPVSPQSPRKQFQKREKKVENKPDLLHFNRVKTQEVKKEVKVEKYLSDRPESPIYENIDEVNYKKRELDSSILDELTKAADQILQAVNGYTDEDSHKMSTDDEKRLKGYKKETLDTISETKSWKQDKITRTNKITTTKNESAKSKLEHTSSLSSVESITKPAVKKAVVNGDRPKKKLTNGEVSSTKVAATKARRLQRASSREALLQSHGSSSEDLPNTAEAPVRKHRLVKRTKATQLTITNGLDIKKSPNSVARRRDSGSASKSEDRVPVVGLPEIRHKTAVSTIRSTAEKAASRERNRVKSEDLKKKTTRKDYSRGTTASAQVRKERSRGVTSRETINHRISTANIKKCSKAEG